MRTNKKDIPSPLNGMMQKPNTELYILGTFNGLTLLLEVPHGDNTDYSLKFIEWVEHMQKGK
jgi:hypothetical protein